MNAVFLGCLSIALAGLSGTVLSTTQVEQRIVLRLKLLSYDFVSKQVLKGAKCAGLDDKCDIAFRIFITGDKKGDIASLAQPEWSAYAQTSMVDFSAGRQHEFFFGKLEEYKVVIRGNGRIKLDLYADNVFGGMRAGVMDHFELNIGVTTVPLTANAGMRPKLLRPDQTVVSKLLLKYELHCDAHHYGRKCDKFCQGRDNDQDGHYTCDRLGNKTCLPGWLNTRENCRQRSRCMPNPCQHNGTCEDLPTGDYRCNCTPNITGQNCTESQIPCTHVQNNCRNGVCGVFHGKPVCTCYPGFSGALCWQSDSAAKEDKTVDATFDKLQKVLESRDGARPLSLMSAIILGVAAAVTAVL